MSPFTVLVVGATGSIGRLVVAEAIRQRYVPDRSSAISPRALGSRRSRLVVGDLTAADTYGRCRGRRRASCSPMARTGSQEATSRRLRRCAQCSARTWIDRPARIAQMTAIGVTTLQPYTARPGTTGNGAASDWYARADSRTRSCGRAGSTTTSRDQLSIVMLQGDGAGPVMPRRRHLPRQIAQILVASLSSSPADRKTLELVAERGAAPDDLEPLFAALEPDPADALDGVLDRRHLTILLPPHPNHGDEAGDHEGDVHDTTEHLQHDERTGHRRDGCDVAQPDAEEDAEAEKEQLQPRPWKESGAKLPGMKYWQAE